MIKKLLLFVTFSLSFWSVFAYSDNTFSVLKHKEWQTGKFDIQFSTSSPEKVLKVNNEKDEGESILLMPSVESIQTDYREPRLIDTYIKTRFQIQLMNYFNGGGEQLYEIGRKICIIPHRDTPNNQLSCVNSKDTISAKDDMNQVVDMDMHVYNLIPGQYFVEMELSILPIQSMAVKYTALLPSRRFTVKPGAA